MIEFFNFDVNHDDLEYIIEIINNINSDLVFGKEIDARICLINIKYKTIFHNHLCYSTGNYTVVDHVNGFCVPTHEEIVLFINENFNKEIILWTIFHELTHLAIDNSKILHMYFTLFQIKWIKERFNIDFFDYYKNNEMCSAKGIHEDNPEEKFANDVADLLMKEYLNYEMEWNKKKGIIKKFINYYIENIKKFMMKYTLIKYLT